MGAERGVPPAGSAHLHAKFLVFLLQALEFLLQGVVLEVLLQGQRGLLPAQPGDSREGTEHPQCRQDGAAYPDPCPLPPAPRQASAATQLWGSGSAATMGGKGVPTPVLPQGLLPNASARPPGAAVPWVKWWDRDAPHSRCGGGGGGLALLRRGGVEVEQVVPHGDLVAQLRDLGGEGASGHGQGDRSHPRPPGWARRGPRPGPCTRGAVTSSLANSSCSSRSSLRSVRLRFCFSRDCPMRAASSRSRSFCKGQVCVSRGLSPALPPPSPALAHPCVPRVPPVPGPHTSPSPRTGRAPTYLIQQVGDGIDVMVGLRDPDHPLSTQDWGRRAKGEPPHYWSAGPGAQPPRCLLPCVIASLRQPPGLHGGGNGR